MKIQWGRGKKVVTATFSINGRPFMVMAPTEREAKKMVQAAVEISA